MYLNRIFKVMAMANCNTPDAGTGTGDAGGTNPAGGTGSGGGNVAPATNPQTYEAANYVTNKEVLSHPIFSGAKTVDDIARIAVEQNAKVGVGTLTLPGEGATTEEKAAFYKQLGRPDDANAYTFGAERKDEKGNVLPNSFEKPVVDGFKSAFHRAGLSDEQAQTLYSDIENMKSMQDEVFAKQINEMHNKTETMLRQKYGAALPEKMKSMQQAVRAVAGEGADDIEALLGDPRFGSDPRITSFLMNLGERLSEPRLRGGAPVNLSTLDPASAREEAHRLMSDKDSPYWDASHPQHNAVRDKIQGLFAIANKDQG